MPDLASTIHRTAPRAARACTLAAAALAASAPSSLGAETAALPASVEVRTPGAYVRTSPAGAGSRRGTLALGARLAPLGRVEAAGCEQPWYRIAAEAWVCGEHLGLSSRPPEAVQLPALAEGEIVPGAYGFAAADGARVYRSLEDVEADEWDRELDPGSGLHMDRLADGRGSRFHRLAEGGFVAAAEVVPARPSRYAGIEIEPSGAEPGEPPVGFVGPGGAVVRAQPGRGRVVRRLGHRSPVAILERSELGRALWLRVETSAWLEARRLVRPRLAEPPAGAGADERWLEVDTSRQLLTAYVGRRPVFATMVSTGRRRSATPPGIFRIWAKLATTSMSGEGADGDSDPYLMQGVPWVMFFDEGIALHGAYWHDGFGRPRSHGCVNLAPRDAARIFEWTSPRLPPGWQGVLPTRSEPGTIVVVR